MGAIDSSLRGMNSIKQTIQNHETGTIIRTQIHRMSVAISPYAKVIFPNFRVAHYFFILTMVILGSIMIYPVKNMRYIDALFLASGASSQAGLNTVDINTISLYQQIVIYVVTCFTTPIFIHGSLLFVRLYYFERHFDNIKEKSKLNFKMRRSATLSGRTQSIDPAMGPTQKNTISNQGLGFMSGYKTNPQKDDPLLMEQDPDSQTESPIQSTGSSSADKSAHESEPSVDGTPIIVESQQSTENDGIKFGNLPQPSKIRKEEIDPSDMFRSIAMLQDDHRSRFDQLNDEDDVLIIRSPNEIEKNSDKPIFTRQSQIHFETSETPREKRNRKHKKGGKLKKKREQWSKLKKSFSNTPVAKSRRKSSEVTFDDEDSIDSELEEEFIVRSKSGRKRALLDDRRYVDEEAIENDDDDEDDDDEDGELADSSDDEVDTDDENEEQGQEQDGEDEESDAQDDDDTIQKAQSHLALPSSDATGGKKFSKRANSLDVIFKNDIVESPTFDRMIGMKRKKNKKKNRSLSFNKTSSSTRTNSRAYDDEESNNDGQSLRRVMSTNYLSWVPTVGRNSTFVHLTEEQKEELGGVEYRAVKLLIKIIVIYYVGFHVAAIVLFLPWILSRQHFITALRDQGVSPTWWAFFTGQSAFNDLGLTITQDSMNSFSQSYFVMIVMSFFIVIGNTGFPIALRFIIWVLFKIAKPLSLFKESLGFLLDHPRRCFTLLFPSIPTWWLFFILIVLNVVDLVLFIVLDLNNNYLSDTPHGYRVMEGLFQAFSTRTAGFSVIDLSRLHPAVQVSYMLMMYISVLPLAISIRRTNVYEEQSLGVYLKENNEQQDSENTPKSFVGAHLRNQLSFDLWFIFLGLFIICIAEGSHLNREDIHFSVFTVLFEIISAYGTVGLSLGYPNTYTSFSYKLSTLSRLVIIAMMIRGRHRGLPYTLDRAIMLPDDDMLRRDKVQEHHAVRRNATSDNNEFDQEPNTLKRIISRWQSTRDSISRRASRVDTMRSENASINVRDPESVQMNNLNFVT